MVDGAVRHDAGNPAGQGHPGARVPEHEGAQHDGRGYDPALAVAGVLRGEAGCQARRHALARDEALGMARELRLEARALLGRKERRLDRLGIGLEDRLESEAVEARAHLAERLLLAAPPGGDRGKPQLLAEEPARELRQEGGEGRGLDHRRAGQIEHGHVAAAHHLDEAGDAELRLLAQLQRIAIIAVDPAVDHVDLDQPLERLEEDEIVAHGEIGTLHDGDAELARQKNVLEIGVVIGPRRQEHDLRRLRQAAADGSEARLPKLEKGLEPAHLGGAEGLGKGARQHRTVVERVAHPGGRLSAVREDAPLPARQAHQVGGVEMEVGHGTLGPRPAQRAQERGIAQHQVGRQQALLDEALRTVEIGEDGIEEACALDEPVGQEAPFRFGQDERQQIESAGRRAGRMLAQGEEPVGVRHLQGRPRLLLGQLLGGEAPNGLHQAAPVGPEGTGTGDHFVVRRAHVPLVAVMGGRSFADCPRECQCCARPRTILPALT